MTKINGIFLKYKNILNKLDFYDLKSLLVEHDEWFNPEDWCPKERSEVDENNKSPIIDWIMDIDPIFVEGGLIDFLHTKLGE